MPPGPAAADTAVRHVVDRFRLNVKILLRAVAKARLSGRSDGHRWNQIQDPGPWSAIGHKDRCDLVGERPGAETAAMFRDATRSYSLPAVRRGEEW